MSTGCNEPEIDKVPGPGCQVQCPVVVGGTKKFVFYPVFVFVECSISLSLRSLYLSKVLGPGRQVQLVETSCGGGRHENVRCSSIFCFVYCSISFSLSLLLSLSLFHTHRHTLTQEGKKSRHALSAANVLCPDHLQKQITQARMTQFEAKYTAI